MKDFKLISEKQIQKEIKYMAHDIDDYLEHKLLADEAPIIVIGLLTGSVHFVSDLSRNMRVDHELAFLQTKSYEDNKSTKKVEFITKLPVLTGYHVILVDDVCDSGRTLKAVTDKIKKQEVASLNTVVLFDKQECREVPFNPDWAGFTLTDNPWIYGYGLDDNKLKRNLKDLWVKGE
jgi:hypoxanthine phosphoribosyltransferase